MKKKKKIKKKLKTKKAKNLSKPKVIIKPKKRINQNTFKTNEEKVEIKKIKKQPTEKKNYNVKD